MAFGNRHRDTSRVTLEDVEEIQKEIEFEETVLKGKQFLKGLKNKKPIKIQNTVFFIDKDEDETHAIKRLTKTFTNSIL
jgi:hypothetical protein